MEREMDTPTLCDGDEIDLTIDGEDHSEDNPNLTIVQSPYQTAKPSQTAVVMPDKNVSKDWPGNANKDAKGPYNILIKKGATFVPKSNRTVVLLPFSNGEKTLIKPQLRISGDRNDAMLNNMLKEAKPNTFISLGKYATGLKKTGSPPNPIKASENIMNKSHSAVVKVIGKPSLSAGNKVVPSPFKTFRLEPITKPNVLNKPNILTNASVKDTPTKSKSFPQYALLRQVGSPSSPGKIPVTSQAQYKRLEGLQNRNRIFDAITPLPKTESSVSHKVAEDAPADTETCSEVTTIPPEDDSSSLDKIPTEFAPCPQCSDSEQPTTTCPKEVKIENPADGPIETISLLNDDEDPLFIDDVSTDKTSEEVCDSDLFKPVDISSILKPTSIGNVRNLTDYGTGDRCKAYKPRPRKVFIGALEKGFSQAEMRHAPSCARAIRIIIAEELSTIQSDTVDTVNSSPVKNAVPIEAPTAGTVAREECDTEVPLVNDIISSVNLQMALLQNRGPENGVDPKEGLRLIKKGLEMIMAWSDENKVTMEDTGGRGKNKSRTPTSRKSTSAIKTSTEQNLVKGRAKSLPSHVNQASRSTPSRAIEEPPQRRFRRRKLPMAAVESKEPTISSPKKKSVRRRKKGPSTSFAPEDDGEQVPMNNNQLKRKRKEKDPLESTEPTDQPNVISVPKRRPGRPPKTFSSTFSVDDDGEDLLMISKIHILNKSNKVVHRLYK